MLKYLILLISFKNIYSTQCSCGLGYRNGAQASDANLCMGPAESSGRPCYPTPCNADWTACTTQPSTNELWTKDTSHMGKRPDCPKSYTTNQNYKWAKLSKCKEFCINEPTGKCNMVSRYGDTVKSDTENYHCRFYACPNPDNFNWITQDQWGNYANKANTYILSVRHYIEDPPCINTINKTRWKNKTRWNNKTRWIDHIINKTNTENTNPFPDSTTDSEKQNKYKEIIQIKCNNTKKTNVKEITSDILSLREVCLIILVIILSGTNCYLIYYIRLNKIVNIIPRNQTTLGIEMTNYTLYGQKHREQSPRNEVIVTAVPVLPK